MLTVIMLSVTATNFTSAQEPDVVVRNADSQKIASIQDEKLIDSKGNTLYTIQGNIVFQGNTTSKNQIELLVKTNNVIKDPEGRVFPQHMKEVKFTLRKGRIYYKKGLQIKDAGLIAQYLRLNQATFTLQDYKGNRLATVHGSDITSAQLIAVFYHVYKKHHLNKNVRRRIANVDKVKEEEKKQNEHGIIKPYWSRGGQEWVWDGEVLKPRWGSNQRDQWQFDGRILKPVYFSDPHNEWVWDGEKLEPRRNDSDINTYIWEDNKLKPYWVSDTKKEYKFTGEFVKPVWGNRPEDEWIVEGNVPKPVIAIVVYGIADR